MKPNNDKLSSLQILQSVMAAIAGIQTEAKLKEVFEKITLGQIIFSAIFLVGSFIATALTLVHFALAAYT